jgi:hypothetical protein
MVVDRYAENAVHAPGVKLVGVRDETGKVHVRTGRAKGGRHPEKHNAALAQDIGRAHLLAGKRSDQP